MDNLATGQKEKILGDMDIEEFKKNGYQLIDWICDYFKNIESYPVLSQAKAGEIKNKLPQSVPKSTESFEEIFRDFKEIIMPGITHWNSPNFFAYFPITGSMPGILGELLASTLNVNGMLWRASPAFTELEEIVLGWFRKMLGLKSNYFGIVYDTASISTLHALCAAREAMSLKIREEGMAGRKNLLPLRLYASSEVHSSVDKAAITIGIGEQNIRKVACDGAFQMDKNALVNLIEEDIKEGCIPFCTVATVGTTATTSIDPVWEISNICKKYKMWLHVDAAYGGSAAIVPEMKYVMDGWNDVDSIVINPHKWLFTQFDLSILYTRRPEILKRAFSLTPEYLKAETNDVTNLMDYGVQLGRRFRALKLWFIMRHFGQDGLISRIREHIRIAKLLSKWMDENGEFPPLAVYFSTVVFRYYPKDLKEIAKKDKKAKEIIGEYLNKVNKTLMENLNNSGRLFLSHTIIEGRFTLRLAIGNIRTTEEHIKEAWELIKEYAKKIDNSMRKELIL